jgi:hypothetical protein
MLFTNHTFATVKNVHIIRTDFGDTLGTYIFPITANSYNSKSVWRSPKGIDCSISLFNQANGSASGSYECITLEGYKAQVSVDCAMNKSQDTAVYLFFGKAGDAAEIGNFYVWCE